MLAWIHRVARERDVVWARVLHEAIVRQDYRIFKKILKIVEIL